ncbi:MAG: hypothetical protein ACI30J_04365 [Paludibacteraceae bacterium]
MKTTIDTNHSMRVFYLPFAYLYGVRMHSIGKFVSWCFLLLVPSLTYFYLSLPAETPLCTTALSYLLLWCSIIPYYELGYMYNDTYTTRKEEKPSLRLTDAQTAYFYQHTKSIYILRLLWVVALLAALGTLNLWQTNSLLTIVWVLLLLPVFQVYNHIRGLKAVLFYPVLVSWRYIPFLLYGYGATHWWALLLLMLFSYPVEISIERFSMPRHRYPWIRRLIPDEPSKAKFRCGYYIVCTLLATLLIYSFSLPYIALIPYLIFAIYRIVICTYTLKSLKNN